MGMEVAMSTRYSIAAARDNFPRLVHEAEQGQEVELTRRGRRVAVLVGSEQFERLKSDKRDFWQAYETLRDELSLAELDIDPDVVFEGVRDRSPGRDFSW